jgi:tetratricopeptide (TPR) repeat protein
MTRPDSTIDHRSTRRLREADEPTVSLCLIVRDEEELLPGCLAAATPAADDLVVIDTGSTDRSVAIARSFGARVLHVPWRDSFSEAKNAALDAAAGSWALFLDADEHLEPGGAAAIRELATTGGEAFALRMTSLTGDGTSSVTHAALRLWRNRPTYRFEGRVHERLAGLAPGVIRSADVSILHHGYLERRWAERDKTRRNLALLAGEPQTPFTAFNLGSEYARVEDWPRACACFDVAWDAVLIDEGWPELAYGPLLAGRTARARRACGRIDDARELLVQAIDRLPDYTDLVFELAHCAVAAGELGEAERLLERCLAQGDAPAPYLATVGAGAHLAQALLEAVTDRGTTVTVPGKESPPLADKPW